MASRVAGVLVAVILAAAAARLLVTGAPEAKQGFDPSPPAELGALKEALRENTISPSRWLALGEGYEQSGDKEQARYCFEQAEKLAHNVPPIWIRAAAYHFRQGQREA